MPKTKLSLALITSLVMSASGQTATPPSRPEVKEIRIGNIEFYGYAGLDVAKVSAALPIHEGDTFSSLEALRAARPQMEEVVQRVTGHPAADVAAVSPGGDVWLVYIGLSGNSMKPFPYNPAPKSTARLPPTAMDIYRQVDEAFVRALQKGAAGEDDSQGYSLSRDDAELRAKQLAMHKYAALHADQIRHVLRSSSDSNQRATAAEFLGYTNQSSQQIGDLVWASHDPDAGVRNNATRALGVLANSNSKTAARIPAGGFIEMLNSGNWTDRNKASELLMQLSKTRTPKLIEALRAKAQQSLLEMAQWRSGHAFSARVLLGRMAGIKETKLQKLAAANDQVEIIINEVQRRR